MNAPFVGAAKLRTAYPACGERIFKCLCVPPCHGIRDRAGVVIAVQKREGAVARTESAVQMNPSAVARSIERGRSQPAPIQRSALISQVCERYERRCCGADVHLDPLRTAAARAPQVRGRSRIRAEHGGGSLACAKSSCDYGIASCDLQRVLM
jgi:hypothetical protein